MSVVTDGDSPDRTTLAYLASQLGHGKEQLKRRKPFYLSVYCVCPYGNSLIDQVRLHLVTEKVRALSASQPSWNQLISVSLQYVGTEVFGEHSDSDRHLLLLLARSARHSAHGL